MTPKRADVVADFAAEARLRFLTLLLNTVEQAVVAVGRDGSIICWNRFAERLYEYGAEEVVGKSFYHALVRPEDRARAQGLLASLAEKRSATGDWLLRRRSGSTIPVAVSVTAIRDDDDNHLGVVVVSWDISEKRSLIGERERAERELAEKRQQLRTLSRRLIEAQEAERKALARELHDDLGQSLAAIRINLEAARRDCGAQGSRQVGEVIALVDQTIDRVRRLALDLRPAMLDDLGLAATLRWLLKTQSQHAGLLTGLEVGRLDGRLAPAVETCCYRIVQEAVNNVTRHASASRVDVTVGIAGAELLVVVRDDGKGFDVRAARRASANGTSLGLLSMQERATLLGGRLAVRSQIGEGTTVEGRLPLVLRGA